MEASPPRGFHLYIYIYILDFWWKHFTSSIYSKKNLLDELSVFFFGSSRCKRHGPDEQSCQWSVLTQAPSESPDEYNFWPTLGLNQFLLMSPINGRSCLLGTGTCDCRDQVTTPIKHVVPVTGREERRERRDLFHLRSTIHLVHLMISPMVSITWQFHYALIHTL